MSENTSFASLLSTSVESAVPPPPVPPGTYAGQTLKFAPVKSQKKGTEGIEVTCAVMAPGPDVDIESWNKVLEHRQGKPYEVSETYWVTPDSLYRLREFLENVCGINTTGRSFTECLVEIPGKQVQLVLKQVQSTKDPSRMVTVLDSIAAMPQQ